MRSVGLRQSLAHRVPVVQRPRTPPFHGDDTGSNPVGDANLSIIGQSLKFQSKRQASGDPSAF
jgi:hypothetical protein